MALEDDGRCGCHEGVAGRDFLCVHTFYSPDEIAECVGVGKALYTRLWEITVELAQGEWVCDGFRDNPAPSSWVEKLTSEELKELNDVITTETNAMTAAIRREEAM